MLALAAGVSILLASAVGALGDEVSIRDGLDGTGNVDLSKGEHAHGNSKRPLRLNHRLVSHRDWRNRDIHCRLNRCKNYVTIQFDTRSDPGYERALYLFANHGRLRAEMFKDDNEDQCRAPRTLCGPQGYIGRARVWRADSKTVVVSFRRWMLRRSISIYRWRASVRSEPDPRCRGKSVQISEGPTFCVDELPNDGRFVTHDLHIGVP